MLPIKMTVTAFGSYAGSEEIDFSKLGKSGVYLITGETGSGKTTIFDAIMYALYGCASGDRSKATLRSQYADPKVKTSVELYFEHKGRTYRVFRSLTFSKEDPTKPNSNQPQIAEIFPDGTKKTLTTGTTQSGDKVRISDILGVDYSQFKQVAMLAQGDFFKLVSAKSDDRRAIFSKIFDTSIFSSVESLAKESALEARQKTDFASKKLRDLSESISENEAHKGEIGGYLENGRKNGVISEVDLDNITSAAQLIINEDTQENERLEARRGELSREITEKTLFISEVKKANALRAELSALKKNEQALGEEIISAKESLEQALKNQPKITQARDRANIEEHTLEKYRELSDNRTKLSALANELDDSSKKKSAQEQRNRELAAARENARSTAEKFPEAESRLAEAKTALDRAKANVAGIEDVKAELERSLKKYSELQTLKKLCVSAERQAVSSARGCLEDAYALVSRYGAELEALGKKADENDKERTLLSARLEALANAERELAEKRSALSSLKDKRDSVLNLGKSAYTKYAAQKKRAADSEKRYGEANNALADAKQKAARMSLAYYGNVVWQLASELEEGAPCPVCGAVHHPSIAQKPDSAPSKEELDAMNEKVGALELEVNSLLTVKESEKSSAQALFSLLEKEGKKLLGESFDANNAHELLIEEYNRLNKKCADEAAALEECIKAVENKKLISDTLKAEDEKSRTIDRERTKVTGSLSSAEANAANLLETLERAISSARSHFERLDIDIEKAAIDEHIPSGAGDFGNVTEVYAARRRELMKSDEKTALTSFSNAERAAEEHKDSRIRVIDRFKQLFGEDIAGRTRSEISDLTEKRLKAAKLEAADALARFNKANDEKRQRDSARERLAQLDDMIEKSTAIISSLTAEITGIEANIENRKADIERLERELSFKTEEDARAHIKELRALANRLEDDINKAKQVLEKTNDSLTRTETKRAALEKQLENAPDVVEDIDKEHAALNALNSEQKRLESGVIELSSRLRTNKTLLADIKKKRAERTELKKRSDMLTLISGTASGSVSGKVKMSLETFVQLHYFDLVIANANERLSYLTNGQFMLARKGAAGDKRTNFGLDLDIVDNMCLDPEKRSRDVNSISGGEKFMTALSLALGLSDEIMKQAGVISFDTLFVDEGFGSLDEESLRLALDVLNKLSSSSNRLIGIISHVEALKSTITRQINVSKNGSKGSKTKIIY